MYCNSLFILLRIFFYSPRCSLTYNLYSIIHLFKPTDKTPNSITYSFFLYRLLDILSDLLLLSTFQPYTDVADTISFALTNQKVYYNPKHQPLFMKIRDWTIVILHKKYFISSSAGIIKKLIQQYISLLRR